MSTISDSQAGEDLPSSDRIDALHEKALADLSACEDADAVEQWRVQYMGRRGELTSILRSISLLPVEERRTTGAAANILRGKLESALEEKSSELKRAAIVGEELDVTLPGRRRLKGGLHPNTQVVREVAAAFGAMGFQLVEGPEVEWEKYNFDALNIPPNHPARDLWDTIWVDREGESPDNGIVLRTHTSPMQARVMEKTEPPVRIVTAGRCFRYEATDATHEWYFYQLEVLAVGEGITFAHLKGTLYEFARRVFGAERKVRFRSDFFPFVEPGVEMAIDCFKCNGKGCSMCKGSGWIEILGAGMVHPKVLRNVGYDPERYTGFAAGLGMERVAMLRHGIDDIRLFAGNDLRFLSQF